MVASAKTGRFSETLTITAAGVAFSPIFPLGGLVDFEVTNTGAAALTAFSLQKQAHPDGDWFDWISGADWATVTVALRWVNGVTATLAGAATGRALVDVGAPYAVRFKATCGTSTTLRVRGSTLGGRS